jgi:hypothetical protein
LRGLEELRLLTRPSVDQLSISERAGEVYLRRMTHGAIL